MFKILKKSSTHNYRLGSLKLFHGEVQTPVFMPVATTGTIKTITPEDLISMGAEIILSNTYHLFLRPGLDVIKSFNGLHNFMSWDRPILTDSGGFQIFSLARLRKITEEGAQFQSHLDGSSFMLTPELVVKIQETLGSDIHMVLDECTPYPVDFNTAEKSMQRSMRWAERSKEARTRKDLLQFGIVQGSTFKDLREQSCRDLIKMDFDGYAIGGVSVGEEIKDMRRITKICTSILPEDRPRYLMGVGTPLDLIESVALGIDMFDCVMPTRNARRGTLFTSKGKLNIKNEKFKTDQAPLDPDCNCYTCKTFSKAYLRHIYKNGTLTSHRLLSLHNLTYYLNLMAQIRASIQENKFNDLMAHHRSLWLPI